MQAEPQHSSIFKPVENYNRPVNAVVKDIVIGAEGLWSIPGPVKSHIVTNGSPPARRLYVAQALSQR